MNPDFVVRGKYDRAHGRSDIVFFERDGHGLDAAENDKVGEFATRNSAVDLELTAFGSDEENGPTDDRRALLEQRLATIVNRLRQAGWTGNPTLRAHERNAEPEIEYRQVRCVQIRRVGAALPGDLTQPAHQPAPPEVAQAFASARQMLQGARDGIQHDTPEARQALGTFFHGADPRRVRAALERIDNLLGRLREAHPDSPEIRPAYRYYTRNCGAAKASHRGSDTLITVGAPLLAKSPERRAGTLVHEGSHAARDVDTEDIAYDWQRLMTYLPPDAALRNADSYMLFTMAVAGVPRRGAPADTYDNTFSQNERHHVAEALAYVEVYVALARQDVRRIYQHAWETIKNRAAWDDRYSGLLQALSDAFHTRDRGRLINYPPEITDDWYLAGIFDRLTQMSDRVRQRDLRIRPGHTTRWTARYELTIAGSFHRHDHRGRIAEILGALIEDTRTIPTRWTNSYRTAVLDMARAGRYGR